MYLSSSYCIGLSQIKYTHSCFIWQNCLKPYSLYNNLWIYFHLEERLKLFVFSYSVLYILLGDTSPFILYSVLLYSSHFIIFTKYINNLNQKGMHHYGLPTVLVCNKVYAPSLTQWSYGYKYPDHTIYHIDSWINIMQNSHPDGNFYF